MSKPVFLDPQQKRWRRLRRVFDVAGVVFTLLIIVFVVLVFRAEKLGTLELPDARHHYKTLKEKNRRRARPVVAAHRKTKKAPSQVVLNSGEGIRAAFYVTWDAGSYSSLHEYVHQIDLLYPEWLHVITGDGRMQGVTTLNTLFDVVQNGHASSVDDKVMPLIRAEKAQTEVFPLVNNYNPVSKDWIENMGPFFLNPAARANFRQQLETFLASDQYRGVTLDFEAFPRSAQPGYRALIGELEQDMHNKGMKLYVSVPVNDDDFDYKYIAAHSDGLIVMNYDQHFSVSEPGPIVSQDWFTRNLRQILKVVPPEKVICALAGYGYDWATPKNGKRAEARNLTVQEAWIEARDSESDIDFDSDTLNPRFAFMDGDVKHDVWFTDAATALNEMRAAQQVGINTFALWRLGSEDRQLWAIWDQPQDALAAEKLAAKNNVPPGQDVDMEGEGEILRIAQKPTFGTRSVKMDSATGLITDENYDELPTPYVINQYGSKPKQVALTFDDGPDPQWTPKMLDVLKRKNAKATFFMIGSQAEKYSGLVRRTYNEGHEIGNHTWTHPDISNIRKTYFQVELNITERFFAAELGAKPLLFRPPYSIDQEPDTSDEVRPLDVAQSMGYITVGDKIDPADWQDKPRRSAEEITADVLKQADAGLGNIVLLHDGGGNRSETVKALPMIIDSLRARGYQIVPVATLLGKTRNDILPLISKEERFAARLSSIGFWIYGSIISAIVFIFFIGDTLMSARLIFVGAGAVYDRFRRRPAYIDAPNSDFHPAVAVLVPAYNEEKVIERTVRAALRSNYPNLRVIVIDDGSSDATVEVAQRAFATEIAAGRVLVLAKANGGKATALNYGLQYVTEDIFVGIDADTIIHPRAISLLVPHFQNPKVAALAGNAKVGNRVNLWTRWQALEYITSQNFERRALNVFGAVTVVPGAIGAWRTSAVRDAQGYHVDTVAEDADLTMRLLRAGYRVEYEDRALAYTEAPTNANGLMRQRFRWSFGILQSVWKHAEVFKKGGALGWIALPNIVIFQIMLPLVSPFIDLMFAFGLINYGIDKYFHPETANASSLHKLIAFFLTFLIIDFIASAIAFALERRGSDRRESWLLLGHVWLQRFAYRQLFSWVLIKTLKAAAQGRPFGWDKLDRTATVRDMHDEPVRV
jgi:peptidoglycan-N-acetylglucosamine deacetylase